MKGVNLNRYRQRLRRCNIDRLSFLEFLEGVPNYFKVTHRIILIWAKIYRKFLTQVKSNLDPHGSIILGEIES